MSTVAKLPKRNDRTRCWGKRAANGILTFPREHRGDNGPIAASPFRPRSQSRHPFQLQFHNRQPGQIRPQYLLQQDSEEPQQCRTKLLSVVSAAQSICWFEPPRQPVQIRLDPTLHGGSKDFREMISKGDRARIGSGPTAACAAFTSTLRFVQRLWLDVARTSRHQRLQDSLRPDPNPIRFAFESAATDG